MMVASVQGQGAKIKSAPIRKAGLKKGRLACLPPGNGAKDESGHGQSALHGEAALIGRFPLRKQGPVFQFEAGRLLGEIDVKSGSREQGRKDESEISYKHRDAYWRSPPCESGGEDRA
jgi:hypothetical protein